MQVHPSRLVLTLAATVLTACDAPEAAPAAPAPRALVDAPLADACLTDTKLILHHEDGTDDVTADLATGLGELARPGDELELGFSVTDECAGKYGPRITLAAATSVGDHPMSLLPTPTPAFDVHAARLDGGPQLLHVRLPRCSYALDLAFGEPLPVQSGEQTYAAQSRLILSSQHAGAACDEDPLAVERFDPVEPGWGDAPVSVHFGWQLAAPPAAQLRCELDLDGDGQADEILDPCPHGTDGIKTAALPLHKYELGKHRPELVVSDGTRRIWAASRVYANHLDYKPGVRFLEQLPGFVSADVHVNPAPDPSKVTLHFAGIKDTPTAAPGQIVVGHGGPQGYMLRVQTATRLGKQLELTGELVGLDAVLAGGFYGVRDHHVAMDGARCLAGPCDAVITPVAEFPPDPDAPAPAPGLLALDAPEGDLDGARGVRFTIPLPDNVGSVTFFGGMLIKSFELEFDWFSIPHANVELTPAIETTLTVDVGVQKTFELPDLFLGVLPTPIPVSVELRPALKLEANYKFTGRARIKLPGTIHKDGEGWRSTFEPTFGGVLNLFESNAILGPEIKATAMPRVALALGPIDGPYFSPTFALGARNTMGDSCETCNTAFFEFGAEFGWNKPWNSSDALFTPLTLTFAEQELWEKCKRNTPFCDPDTQDPQDPPPGGGGSGGDVHLLSHDGLHFDFQAGGEFVLTRAVAGAPFEVQARQEPVGDFRSLSYNTAIATRVGDHRVGFYAREADRLRVDGVATALPPGATLDLGGGVLTRHDEFRYSITYTGGEVLHVRRIGETLNVRVKLPPSRAGQVVGLLGDADRSIVDDIALSADTHLAQPVSEQQLYRGDDSFAAAWRLAPAASLFDYAVGTSAATYRTPHYLDMPVGQPPVQLPHADLANELCAACPAALRDSCRLDVGVTGDPELAVACVETDPPVAVMYPADGPTIVSPRNGGPLDCSGIAGPFTFRAPGAASAGPGVGPGFTVAVQAYNSWTEDWYTMSTDTSSPLGEYNLVCTPLGSQGWGECVFTAADPLCTLLDGSQWSQHAWSVTAQVPPQVGAATSVASFTVP